MEFSLKSDAEFTFPIKKKKKTLIMNIFPKSKLTKSKLYLGKLKFNCEVI